MQAQTARKTENKIINKQRAIEIKDEKKKTRNERKKDKIYERIYRLPSLERKKKKKLFERRINAWGIVSIKGSKNKNIYLKNTERNRAAEARINTCNIIPCPRFVFSIH